MTSTRIDADARDRKGRENAAAAIFNKAQRFAAPVCRSRQRTAPLHDASERKDD
jgi:hypothetical protein